jgi:Flp pilus assembly protein TadD
MAPNSAEGPFRLAHLLLTSGDPRGARSVLDPAVRKAPGEARLLQLLAMTYSARWGDQEQPDQEGQLLSNAMKAGGAVPAHLALGELYLHHQRFKEGGGQLAALAEQSDLPAARRALAIALEAMGQEAEACYQRGLADAVENRMEEALREFRALAARSPRDRRAPQLISQAYAQMKQLNAALKAAEAFYRQGNRSPELYERLATLYLVTYDRRAGRRLCEEWQRAQPESGQPLAHLGRLSLSDLRLSEAVTEYEGAVAREPKNAQYRLGLADALAQQPSPQNTRRALALLREAATLAPHDAAAHYQLGVRLQQAGQWEEARRELLRALDEDPTMAAADNNMVQVAMALRQPALARRFASLMRAVQGRQRAQDAAWLRRWERPADPEVYSALARLETGAGDLASAENPLQRAVALRPGWPEATRLRDRVRRLLDGVDADGRRLVQFPERPRAGGPRAGGPLAEPRGYTNEPP